MDENCGANRNSTIAKIAAAFLLSHVNFTGNTQFEFVNCFGVYADHLMIAFVDFSL